MSSFIRTDRKTKQPFFVLGIALFAGQEFLSAFISASRVPLQMQRMCLLSHTKMILI